MTKDYIAIARTRRLVALTEVQNRKRNGKTVAKIEKFQSVKPAHVDAVFKSSRSVAPLVLETPLAA